MASNDQGTGKHPHKSAAEPYPHTKDSKEGSSSKGSSQEATSGKESSSSKSGGSHSAGHSNEQGTGKHPHKSAEDPKEHHEGAHSKK